MTVGSTTISGADATNYGLDMPTLMACIRFSEARWCSDGHHHAADESDTAKPATLGFDGHCGAYTQPDGAQQVWWYVAALASGHTSMDALFLHVNALGGAVDVSVYLSDSESDVGDVAISNVDADYLRTHKRMFMPCLQVSGDSGDTQRRFTGVTYIKIKFDAGGGNTCQPQLNELACGLQRQLNRRPIYPWDKYDRDDLSDTFTSGAGVQTTYTHASSLFSLDATWQVSDATQRGKWTSFNDDLHGNKCPFVWCLLPKSDPHTCYLMCRRSPGFRLPRTRPQEWTVQLSAVEQGGSLLVDE